MNKTVIVFTKYFCPDYAGREVNMYETYTNLVKEGWKVKIHTSQSTHQTKDILLPKEDLDGLKIRRYPHRQYMLPFWIRKLNLNNTFICLHEIAHIPDLFIYFYLLFQKKIRRKKFIVIFSSHGLYSLRYQLNNGVLGQLKRLVDKVISLAVLNQLADGFRSISSWEAKYMSKAGIKNVRVITNGLPQIAFADVDKLADNEIKTQISRTGRYILQVGRINRLKNLEDAINALNYVKNKKVSLMIVGPVEDKKYFSELKKLIANLDLDKRVHFLGEISGYSKYYLFKHSAAYIQMSRSEGFSNTVYEAMSQGCVCIVSAGTALEDLILNNINGFTAPVGHSKSIAKKINFILAKNNTSVIAKMKEENIHLTQGKTWKDTAHRVGEFYLEIAKNRI